MTPPETTLGPGKAQSGDADGVRTLAERVLRAESDAVARVADHLDGAFEGAVQRILDATSAGSASGSALGGGSLIVSGIGKSGLIGAKLAATFASTGTPSHFIHATEAAHGDLGRIRAGDVALLLSFGGASEEVVSLAALLRQDKVPVISITGRPTARLAELADFALCVGPVDEACPNNLAPTSSTTAMLALGDALAMAVSHARGFSADDFRKSHPGGLLGKRMLPLTDVMRFRAGDNLPLIEATGTVAEALAIAERAPRRAGAMVLIDGEGRLAGILTDADVRRRLVSGGPSVLDQPVAEIMTRSPKRLRGDDLVRDAVQLVREVRLDEIPVVDADDRPLGLIDVQDLIALKVIEDPE